MVEKRHRISGHLIKRHMVEAIMVWLKAAQEMGFYPEEIINMAMERMKNDAPGDGGRYPR